MARPARSTDTRARILEVAEEAFADQGFAGAHLQHIASQIGVQKTALYYYFESKADLYQSVLLQMLESFDATVERALSVEGSHALRLERLLDDLNDLLAERPNYSRILIRVFVDDVSLQGRGLNEPIESVVGRVLRFYRAGVDAGAFHELSSRNVFQSLLGSVVFHYATRWFGAAVLGVEDVFDPEAVAWRRQEVKRLWLRAAQATPS